MENYRSLYTIKVEHRYFKDNICNAFEININNKYIKLLKDRQLILKKESKNCWHLIGNTNGNGIFDGLDSILLEFVLSDLQFFNYTEKNNFDPKYCYEILSLQSNSDSPDLGINVFNELEILKTSGTPVMKKKINPLFSIELNLTNEMFEKSESEEPYRLILNFDSKEVKWEYIFIQRKENENEEEIINLVLKEKNGEIIFSEPIEIPSSNKTFVIRSTEPVLMKEHYNYKINLSENIETDTGIDKPVLILEDISHPEPEKFHDTTDNYIRQVVYFKKKKN